jgi:hypothetical protein
VIECDTAGIECEQLRLPSEVKQAIAGSLARLLHLISLRLLVHFIHDVSDILDTFGDSSTQQHTGTRWHIFELLSRRLHLTMDFSFESHRAAFADICYKQHSRNNDCVHNWPVVAL